MAEVYDRNHAGQKAERRVEITGTECGKNFMFILHGNHIEVRTVNDQGHNQPAGPEWFDQLNDHEKLKVFNRILAEYRQRSMGEGGFKLASLGVTENGHIYVSENSEQLSGDYNRQCAENNMVVISGKREVYNQIQANMQTGKTGDAVEKKYPPLKAVYLMGGRDDEDPSQRITIACPCGYCTDLLAKNMKPDAPVWILPVNDGFQNLAINYGGESGTKMAKDLRPHEAWCVPISYLNKERVMPLDVAESDMQREGLKRMAAELSHELLLKFRKKNTHISRSADDSKTLKLLTKSLGDGMPPAELNKFQYLQIKLAILDRLEDIVTTQHLKEEDLTPAKVQKLITDNVTSARCAVVQLDNQQIGFGIDITTKTDKASTMAEEDAKGMVKGKLGTQGIRRARVMEFNTDDIDIDNPGEPAQMHTSPKGQGIERLVKVRSKVTDSVEFGFMPFNSGGLSREKVIKSLKIRQAEDIFPGFFTGKGSQKVEALEAEKRAKIEVVEQKQAPEFPFP